MIKKISLLPLPRLCSLGLHKQRQLCFALFGIDTVSYEWMRLDYAVNAFRQKSVAH